jgi:hypothetical protein
VNGQRVGDDRRFEVQIQAGSTEGAHRACVLLGIVATCRAQCVPVQKYAVTLPTLR